MHRSICRSVCFLAAELKKLSVIFRENFGRVGQVTRHNRLDFGDIHVVCVFVCVSALVSNVNCGYSYEFTPDIFTLLYIGQFSGVRTL